MSDDDRDGGISGSGAILGVGAGAGAAYVGDRMLAKEAVKEAWQGKEQAPSGVADKVKGFFKKNTDLKKQADGINAFNSIKDPIAGVELTEKELKSSKYSSASIKSFEGKLKAAERAHDKALQAVEKNPSNPAMQKAADKAWKDLETATKDLEKIKNPVGARTVSSASYTKTKDFTKFEFGEQTSTGAAKGKHTIKLKTLPADAKSGVVATTDEALTGAFKNAKSGVATAEKELTRDIHKGIGMKMGEGVKFGSNLGRAKVGAAVLGTVAVGYAVGNAMFPSHANRVRREREAERDLGRV